MGFLNIISTHVFRVSTRTGAPLVVAVLETTGSEIVSLFVFYGRVRLDIFTRSRIG